MLTKELIGDYITILPNGCIEKKTVTAIMEDGIEIARTTERSTYTPLDDLTKITDRAQSVATLVWTDEVKQAFEKEQADANKTAVAQTTSKN